MVYVCAAGGRQRLHTLGETRNECVRGKTSHSNIIGAAPKGVHIPVVEGIVHVDIATYCIEVCCYSYTVGALQPAFEKRIYTCLGRRTLLYVCDEECFNHSVLFSLSLFIVVARLPGGNI